MKFNLQLKPIKKTESQVFDKSASDSPDTLLDRESPGESGQATGLNIHRVNSLKSLDKRGDETGL